MTDRFHILIVEDEPLIVDVICASLESEYRLSSVNTVVAALALLRTSHVDLVLVDTVLPDGRGTEVARLAIDLGAAVVEMSGYPQEMQDVERSERLFLRKPFGVEALLSTIRNAIHKIRGPSRDRSGILTLQLASEGSHGAPPRADPRRDPLAPDRQM